MANLRLDERAFSNLRNYTLYRKPHIKYRKFLIDIKTSGKIRDSSYLYEKALRGRILGIEKGNKKQAKAFKKQIESVIKVLDDVHKENWDFHFRGYTYDSGKIIFTLFVVIHYPEFEITNSKNEKHTIKDMFVSFDINRSKYYESYESKEDNYIWFFKNIKGTRTTFSYKEIISDYAHSHMSWFLDSIETYNVLSLHPFCFGYNSDIQKQQNALMVEYTPESFEFFLLLIDSFLKWESLKGTPYRKISNINFVSSNAKRAETLTENDMLNCYIKIRKHIKVLDVDFVFNINKYIIKENDKFNTFIKNIIINDVPDLLSSSLAIKTSKGYYLYAKTKSKKSIKDAYTFPNGGVPYFYLRDKKITFKVNFDGEYEIPKLENYIVHTQLLKFIKNEIEKELYENSIKQSTIERYNKGNYA